jgi:hypothetical protein
MDEDLQLVNYSDDPRKGVEIWSYQRKPELVQLEWGDKGRGPKEET